MQKIDIHREDNSKAMFEGYLNRKLTQLGQKITRLQFLFKRGWQPILKEWNEEKRDFDLIIVDSDTAEDYRWVRHVQHMETGKVYQANQRSWMLKHETKIKIERQTSKEKDSGVVVIGDTQYQLSRAFLRGAKACKEGIPWKCNPYCEHEEEKQSEWDAGHEIYSEYPQSIEQHLGAAQGFR